MLQQHVDPAPTSRSAASRCRAWRPPASASCMSTRNDRIVSFLEKPKDPPGIPGNPDMALASMGIYVFRTDAPVRPAAARRRPTRTRPTISARTSSRTSSSTARRVAHRFAQSCVKSDGEAEAYWRDVGTVDAYWEANIDLTSFVPALDLYDQNWPIWTYGEITPPAKFVHDEDGRRGMAVNSLVSGGCIVSGAGLQQLAAVHRRPGPFLRVARGCRGPALCRDRPLRPAARTW